MKLKIKSDYWKKTDGWQKTASKTNWIALFAILALSFDLFYQKQYIIGTIIIIIAIGLIPQRIAYSKYTNEKIREELGLKNG